MSNVGSNASILASRRGGDVLIADEPVRVELAWPDLRSADGDEVRITWSASLACVDSAADRALLAERYLGGDGAGTLSVARVASDLAAAMTNALRSKVDALRSDALEGGAAGAELAKAIESAARGAAFAAGLAMLPPFQMSLAFPTREREQRLAAAREQLAAIAANDEARARALAEATRVMVDAAADPKRAARAIAALRLSDPLDLLRAAAVVDPAWSSPEPSLWIAAGTRLLRVDPTRPVVSAANAPSIGDALGPIRSVSTARIDGENFLLIGARDGVHAVTIDGSIRVVRSFRQPTGGDFGFNAATFLAADRTLVATHSRVGVVAWRWDEPGSAGEVSAVTGARSIAASDERAAVLVVDGRLATFSAAGGVVPVGGNVQTMNVSTQGRTGRRGEIVRGDGGDARYTKSVGIEDEIDIAGVPRTVRPLVAGGLETIDDAGAAAPLRIGPPTIAARSVAARPGFIAAVSTDRTRIALIDLSRPDVVAAELHVSATLGSRVADAAFA